MKNNAVTELIELAKTGTDTDVKAYVHSHWIDFPIDIQDALAVALMTDAVRDHVASFFTEPTPATA